MSRFAPSTDSVNVTTRGDVNRGDQAYAREKVGHVLRYTSMPVPFARVVLIAGANPARPNPAVAEAGLDVRGRAVRVKVAAATMHEAIDLLEARLRQRLERVTERARSESIRHRGDEWHHGDPTAHRPPYFDRPAEDREIVRHKSFAVGATNPEEAVLDMELLDHDFFLFTNADTGEDDVVHRLPGGRYALIQPTPAPAGSEIAPAIEASPLIPAPMTVDDAVALLDLGAEPFVFSLDPETRRGGVLYRRYDGHYGLITPAS
ncbi:MAG: ribosome hibernation promotion factor [Microthrixaceae bacterium]